MKKLYQEGIQYISWNKHFFCGLFWQGYAIDVIGDMQLIHPYSSGFFHWPWDNRNHMIAPGLVKQAGSIWLNFPGHYP